MSLGEDLMKLSISGTKKAADPVSDATRKGRIPTLGEVKRSLKVISMFMHALLYPLTFSISEFDQKFDTSDNPNGCFTQCVSTLSISLPQLIK